MRVLKLPHYSLSHKCPHFEYHTAVTQLWEDGVIQRTQKTSNGRTVPKPHMQVQHHDLHDQQQMLTAMALRTAATKTTPLKHLSLFKSFKRL